MRENQLYYKGYMAGYQAGVKDTVSGKIADWQSSDIVKLPIRAMGLSTCACNCLNNHGCTYVEDVIGLDSDSIMTMRNLGAKTASEIAGWLTEHGIYFSSWNEYL